MVGKDDRQIAVLEASFGYYRLSLVGSSTSVTAAR